MKNVSELTKCPYCGCEEYYIKQSISGTIEFRCRYDGKEADNREMYDHIYHKLKSKFAYCSSCDKRVALLEEELRCYMN